jgi:protein kinase C substrate 80K-H
MTLVSQSKKLRFVKIFFYLKELDLSSFNELFFIQKLIDQKTDLNAQQFYELYYDQISSHLKFIEEKPIEASTPEHAEEPSQEEVDQQLDENQEQEYDGVEEGSTDTHEVGEEVTPNRRFVTTTKSPQESQKYSSETQGLLDKTEATRQEFDKAVRELNEIKEDIEKLNKKLSLDNGPNEEYASLIDQCFEYDDREYTYILCPYDRTVQKSKSNHGETSIGTWSSWDIKNPASKYSAMLYQNGLTCWNGPARSCKVHLSCGVENKITSVAEPNRCEYEMKFETPTACDESFLTNLHKERDRTEL